MSESTNNPDVTPEPAKPTGLKKYVDYAFSGWRPWALVGLLGCVLYFPGLGTSGLWDPWETHYAEVAREMVESGNWLEPTWEHSPGQSYKEKYFFSKPVLVFWLLAVPMKIFGVQAAQGGIVSGAEWYLRIPFALIAILGLFGIFALGANFFGKRVGLLAAVILGTSAQYYFIARQAMTDMPLVGLMTAGISLLLIGGFDDDKPRPGLLYSGYALLGMAVLAKGLTGFLLPGLVFLLYFIISADWARLKNMRVFTGGLIALLMAAPWFIYMSILSAVDNLLDDEKKTFFQRFFLHDHLYRIGHGVHGDRGTFAYFIKQLGLGTHPWFPFMVWGGIRSAQKVDRQKLTKPERVELFVLLWALAGFCVYALSVTKFHHYALPTIPALALLAAIWLVRWSQAKETFGRILIPLALILGVIMISRDIGLMPKNLTDLFVYNYTRDFPKDKAVIGQIGYGIVFGLMSLALTVFFLFFRKRLAAWTPRILVIGALLASIWGGWYFFNQMGPHWTQRHMFDSYYALRKQNEPIGAYLMNWRGETFYSCNQVTQLKNNTRLKAWVKKHQGKRLFILVEKAAQGCKLTQTCSPGKTRPPFSISLQAVTPGSCSKTSTQFSSRAWASKTFFSCSVTSGWWS
ncbi:MAG: glycosyltransferase family 39 protein [Deltaproteobacteria bacterium]|nr:glycosyltransferase family 39 protein [Deltaproteobacteria bacterium]